MTPWERLRADVAALNKGAEEGTGYRVLFLARHGQGFHNVAGRWWGAGEGVCWANGWVCCRIVLRDCGLGAVLGKAGREWDECLGMFVALGGLRGCEADKSVVGGC